MNKRPRFDIVPLEEEMQRLSLNRVQRGPLQSTGRYRLPTWGQMKKLAAERARLVREQEQVQTVETLFLAMLALTSVQVSMAGNFTYWASSPHPPLHHLVTWADAIIPIYINDSNWIPGPYNTRGAIKPKEEVPFSLFIRLVETIFLFAWVQINLNKFQGIRLFLIYNGTKTRKSLLLLTGKAFRGQNVSHLKASGGSLPPCTIPIAENIPEWIQRVRWKGPELWQLTNSTPVIYDWSPQGEAKVKQPLVH